MRITRLCQSQAYPDCRNRQGLCMVRYPCRYWTISPRACGLDSVSGASETVTVGIGFRQLRERRSSPRVGRERRWRRFEHQRQRSHCAFQWGVRVERMQNDNDNDGAAPAEKWASQSYKRQRLQVADRCGPRLGLAKWQKQRGRSPSNSKKPASALVCCLRVPE